MAYLKSYKRLNRLMQNESFEPMISWGLRMALAGTLPVLWGLATGRLADAIWITLAGESVSWVELKGAFVWRFRTLLVGAVLAVGFGILGSVTGTSIWWSVVCMFGVGFLATLLKNIGDRASGLGLCVYLLFIICNAYPVTHYTDVAHRFGLLMVGALWPVMVGTCMSLVMPAQQPFRRQIALIWRAVAGLTDAVSAKDTGVVNAAYNAAVFVQEKDVRAAIDSSYQFYGQMAHQASKKDNTHYQLVLLRKIASLVAVNLTAISDEMRLIEINDLDKALRIKAGTLFSALKESVSRISIFVISLRPEEKLLALSHINRMKKLSVLIREFPLPADEQQRKAITRILQLTDRTTKLLENAILRIDQMGNDIPVFRSYPLIKTLFVLKPKYLIANMALLFNFNTHTFRYALRSAIAVTVGLFIYKWYNTDHGYWLPFSVMIIIQPYFGATFKRAIDRVAGTLLGGLAGSFLLYLPPSLHINEAILFLTFIFMVYYLRRNYAVAAFVITLNLVLLFNIESAYNNMLMVTRAICTIGGALLAIGAGWAVLPTWDKKWLPAHLAGAINANCEYFMATFYPEIRVTNWTRYKRVAESKNSNVFDSFNRYMQEPGSEKTDEYYDLITGNIRITRNLNNIHLEQDEQKEPRGIAATALQQQKIDECRGIIDNIIGKLSRLDPGFIRTPLSTGAKNVTPFELNETQMMLLEKVIIELKTMQKEIAQ